MLLKKSELFLSAASPSNLEPKKSIKGAGKTILGDPGAKKHHFDDSLIELKGPHQEEIQKQKEFISKTMDVVMGKFPNCPCIDGGAICPSGSTGLLVDIMFT
jgi:hypothetical protein